MSDRNFAAWDRAYDRVRTAATADEARHAEYALAGLDVPRERAAADAEDWATHVMVGPSVQYQPGTKVRWLDGGGNRRQGTVIGAIAAPCDPTDTYVILVTGPWVDGYPSHTIEQVDALVLAHGWGEPESAPTTVDDDVPF